MSDPQHMELSVGRSRTALIDVADYEMVSPISWHAQTRKSGLSYARAVAHGKTILMHRLIMNAPLGLSVDHINGNGLDNRRSNLRVCTHMQNMQNRKMHSNNSSGLKGAYKEGRRWVSRISAFGKKHELGMFDTAAEAHSAYIEAAHRLHGEWARQSSPSLFLPAHSTKEPQPIKVSRQFKQLSPAERLVMDLLSSGLEPGEVAVLLGRQTTTISTHLKRIREKLGTRSTIHSAIVYARQNWYAHAEYESWSGIFEVGE